MLQTLWHSKGRILRYWVVIFLILSVIFFGVTLTTQNSSNSVRGQWLLQREVYFVDTIGTLITARLSRIVTDLVFIKESFRSMTDSGNNRDAFTVMAQQWLAFANAKKQYDQIRYIDANGNEALRVEQGADGAVRIADDKLQSKKASYYFTDTLRLSDRGIFISRIDLNVENGLIQTPRKPMIRVATPVYDIAGKATGILVLNYLGDELFNLIKPFTTTGVGSFAMLNADGYWLNNGADKSLEWGFMYEDMVDVSFAKRYPVEWQAMQENIAGSTITDNGVFVYNRIFSSDAYSVNNSGYPITLGSGDWFIYSRIPLSSSSGTLIHNTTAYLIDTTLQNYFYIYFMILLISLVIAVLLTINRNESDAIRFFSEFDAMTGALNRRGGLKLLNTRYIGNPDRRCSFGFCFVDINGLKEVNDTLGHDMGDELICTVVNMIEKSIRESDLVIRLGGDEFLIVFDGMNEEECESVWQRALAEFEAINRTENRPYLISASHGIEAGRCFLNDSIDLVLNSADEKMYIEKRLLKPNLKVIREKAPVVDGESPNVDPAFRPAGDDASTGTVNMPRA